MGVVAFISNCTFITKLNLVGAFILFSYYKTAVLVLLCSGFMAEQELEHLVGGKPATATPRNSYGNIVLSQHDVSASFFGAYLAISLALLAIVFIILLALVDIYIKHPGVLSNSEHALYVTGTTIIASVIATFLSNQVRLHWLASVFAAAGTPEVKSTLHLSRTKRLLGLGTWRDQLSFWPISVSFIITSLITTAIVSSITPSVSPVEQSTIAWLYPEQNDVCFEDTHNGSSGGYTWRLSDGSFISLNATNCATNYASTLMDQTFNSSGCAYALRGVCVDKSAVGTPVSIPQGKFDLSFGVLGSQYGASALFQYATACFPILKQTPVQCRRTGNVTIGANEVIVEAEGCKIVTPIFAFDPSSQGATPSGACTDGLDVGKANIVMGAVNGHANLLAQVMYDSNFSAPQQGSATYAVACNVDIAPSIALSLVNYSRLAVQNEQYGTSASYNDESYTVNGTGSICTPFSDRTPILISSILTNRTLAIGAAANQQLLSENRYRDGWWRMIYGLTQNVANLDGILMNGFVFNNSRNPLEDVLGLVSGTVLGAHWGTSTDNLGIRLTSGNIVIDDVRMGPGGWPALLYIIPEIYAASLIAYLLWRGRKHQTSKARAALVVGSLPNK